jgi:hypothetical protein
MVPARKNQSRFKWLTTRAKFVASNSLDLKKNPQEEFVLSKYFKPSQLDFSNCDSESRIFNFE